MAKRASFSNTAFRSFWAHEWTVAASRFLGERAEAQGEGTVCGECAHSPENTGVSPVSLPHLCYGAAHVTGSVSSDVQTSPRSVGSGHSRPCLRRDPAASYRDRGQPPLVSQQAASGARPRSCEQVGHFPSPHSAQPTPGCGSHLKSHFRPLGTFVRPSNHQPCPLSL